MKKAKTPLISFLQNCFRQASIAENHCRDFAEEIKNKQNTELQSRRQFIAQALGAAAIGGIYLSSTEEVAAQRNLPTIAIIGGGIAGLNAAYQLRKAGFRANVKIYEASSDNSWGRIQTKNMGGGITAELGGEFVDSDHADMIQLAREFGLTKINVDIDGKGLIKDSYFFNGRHYSEKEVVAQFKNIAGRIRRDNAVYESNNSLRTAKLDNTSIEQYLRENLGLSGWLYDLLNVAYTSEFGLEIGEQSSLNFITMIGTDLKAPFKMFGDSDELYKIKGGNAQIISTLKKKVENQIENGYQLESLRKRDKKYALSFTNGKEINTDFVVLAVPFTTLRNVKFSEGLFNAKKMKAIKELGYGTSSKLLLETKSRIWRTQRRAGYLFSKKIHNGWDYSQGQNNNIGKGGYTVFLGGEAARRINANSADDYVNELDNAFSGFKNSVTDNLIINWAENPLVKGGYACYKVGQWTSISGEEIKPQGNIFFCGEHCSSDYQGYMNGGAETGRQAAENVLKRLNVGKAKTR